MSFRKYINKIHLWLGLMSGLIVFISILPASLFVWEKELTNWWYSSYIYVEPQQNKLPLSELNKIAQSKFQDREVLWVDIDSRDNKSYIFQTYKAAENPGLTFFSELEYWDKIYINPYNGKLLGVVDVRYDWIYLLRMMHQQLLLNYEIGHWPVAIATLILFVMLVSGLILWWPKNKASIKQRLKVRWTARWRRKNYDLHSVSGFYASIFVLILAITGLVWSFKWWQDGIYRIMGDNPKEVFSKEKHIIGNNDSAITDKPLDVVYDYLTDYRPNWDKFYISFDKDENNQLKEYSAWVEYQDNSLWDESDYLFFHPRTGALIHKFTHEEKSLGEKWRNSNYAIHVGSIWGYPTKILASIVSLFCAFLPVSGLIIWYGRKKKIIKHSKGIDKIYKGNQPNQSLVSALENDYHERH